jgi:hypothetical protein
MSEMSRREFAETITLATLAPLLDGTYTPVRLPALVAAAEDPGALAKALTAAIRAQYASRLSEADLGVVTRQIQAALERAAKVRKVPLTNGDEPDFLFSPVRVPGVG